MRRWLLGFLGFLALSGMARPCSYGPYQQHVPGQTFRSRPTAVFEARVVEVRDEQEVSGITSTPVQNGIVEVTRSLHGWHRVGERLPTHSAMNSSCSYEIRVGQELTFWLRGETPPYTPGDHTGPGEYEQRLMFREIADVSPEARHSERPALAGVKLRGEISDRAAQKLLERARPAEITACEIRRGKHFAQVGCGSAYDGNDVRYKVIFERVNGRWREVFRYEVPANPAAASAGSTS